MFFIIFGFFDEQIQIRKAQIIKDPGGRKTNIFKGRKRDGVVWERG
jgi:hypothetical protein